MSGRYDAEALTAVVADLFERLGLEAEKAERTARTLVEADAIGHATHGLAIAPWYAEELRSGNMRPSGAPETISDTGSCLAWNGRRLPGAWLIHRALDIGMERVATNGGIFAATIGDGHHTGALATYQVRAAERGLFAIIACSGPASQGVAPFGGRDGVFTPNPLSAGIPTNADPILLDLSASISTIKRSTQMAERGEVYEHDWVLDAEGNPSRDPRDLLERGGTLMPVGGLDHGHKGYGMALLVEAMTQGLSGVGRRQVMTGISMNTFVLLLDPASFGGSEAFRDEMSWLADACRASRPRPNVDRVRLPGDRALALRAAALAEGVPLSSAIVSALGPCLARSGLAMPDPIA
ncbi:Ldh family oxidoreductase [Aureimonas flava]|uniref:Ldh family oxidoreductase n=1 Tax=Aureimonas flava TaxID=2320271 RepID=A0A3A1WJS2_9HYPH|nr:Ldh family oxidoreductase [Aureimonas flava]RIY01400.1 Ldh family oxidoreductase [Aureimonas flava]